MFGVKGQVGEETPEPLMWKEMGRRKQRDGAHGIMQKAWSQK